MKISYPNYYCKFSCIMDKCKHSCCIGWEIEIDKKTLDYYASLEGETGKKICSCILDGSFALTDDERCPFLNEDGLCLIITELGEDAICDICREHPRFRNFYSCFEEVGLGLCCEEAARIILGFEEPFELSVPNGIELTSEEKFFFAKRNEVFDILQNREESFLCRIKTLASKYDVDLTWFAIDKLKSLFLPLERLEAAWTDRLESLSRFEEDTFSRSEYQLPLEQLACYLVFRHFGSNGGDYYSSVCFALAGTYLVCALWEMHRIKNSGISILDMAEYARAFSAEIEYSKENIDALFGAF